MEVHYSPISPSIPRFMLEVNLACVFGVTLGVVFGVVLVRAVIWLKKGQSECCELVWGLTGNSGFYKYMNTVIA
jgi:hypothetical protein